MKLLLNVLLGIVALMSVPMVRAQAPTAKGVEGLWQGTLAVSGIPLRLVAHITRKADGTLSATLDSPDQGAKGIAVAQTTFANGTLHLDIKAVQATFEGKLSTDGAEISGTFTQGGTPLPLTLKRTDKVQELARPQEPKPPFPYAEREVTYENAKAGIKKAGTLTIPSGKGPFPAVLLITGSGAHDRNETLFAHKPFLLISDYLTRLGIAVLRTDDRGVGGSTGNKGLSTSLDLADDVVAGVEYLKEQKEIDPRKIGLIGHSEGGLIAPIAASESHDVAFIVLMAGPGLSGEQILYLQGALISKADGASDEAVAHQRSLQEQMFAIVKQEKDDKVAEQKLDEVVHQQYVKLSDAEKAAVGNSETSMRSGIKAVLSPWFRAFLTLDPRTYLRRVQCPVLAINGGKDLQVPPKEDLASIAETLKEGGNKDYTTRELPGLNHLFQPATTGSPSEYGQIEVTIAPVALQTMGDWIVKHTRARV